MSPVALDVNQNRTTVTLSEYVFRRILSLSVHSIFGVPGDFNLSFLECLMKLNEAKGSPLDELHWYGTCNELNGAYATDGYARTTGKLGVLVTTMGVGELSAINGISGSFAEYVPILHIVGTTPTTAKGRGLANHHLVTNISPLEKTDHYVYQRMAESVSCRVESIVDPADAPNQIDDLIATILTEKKPGYLYIPCNLATLPVDASNLISRQGMSFYERSPVGSREKIEEITDLILEKVYEASRPCIIADGLVDRFGLTKDLRRLVSISNLPNSNTPMGKSLLNELGDYYVGDFIGDESAKQTASYVRACDLLLHFGNFDNETNSGHFSTHKGFEEDSGKTLILLNPRYIKVGSRLFNGYSVEDVLPLLLSRINTDRLPVVAKPNISAEIENIPSCTPISETDILELLKETLRDGDTLVVETGSLLYGMADVRLPDGCKMISQPFYLSIGMGLPCSFGASIAKRELGDKGRLILVEGDGAAQMTIQELSNYNREGLNPLILVLNNEGYTVERAIKGPTREYNDIRPNWKWTQILDSFGVKNKSRRVDELEDLKTAMEEFGDDSSCARLIEIGLDKLDVPWRFNCMLGGYE
ncbi:DEKNAAC100355 [Brettanomyces naardenensis]|uniref:DEKNAAC100355 n=1 Tax=Brettanomyces naardenensis TaxID=13370 RepID=A0A448YEL3_BRENA|nr:DEKNAAC100355 [Brettanomyces naardenensis]